MQTSHPQGPDRRTMSAGMLPAVLIEHRNEHAWHRNEPPDSDEELDEALTKFHQARQQPKLPVADPSTRPGDDSRGSHGRTEASEHKARSADSICLQSVKTVLAAVLRDDLATHCTEILCGLGIQQPQDGPPSSHIQSYVSGRSEHWSRRSISCRLARRCSHSRLAALKECHISPALQTTLPHERRRLPPPAPMIRAVRTHPRVSSSPLQLVLCRRCRRCRQLMRCWKGQTLPAERRCCNRYAFLQVVQTAHGI
jgi:hypothetical protein